jgi:hypothetical protein
MLSDHVTAPFCPTDTELIRRYAGKTNIVERRSIMRRYDFLRRKTFATVGAILLGVAGALIGSALADAQPAPTPPPTMVQKTVTGVATVETVDHATRQVLLRLPSGKLLTVTVGPQVRNLPQVRAGDHVNITYQQVAAVRLAPPGSALPAASGEAGMVRAAAGQLPAGTVFTMVHVVVRVNSMDMTNHTVTFTDPDGTVHTVVLRTAAMQNFASQLKPGNNVRIDYLQGMTITVQRP